MITDRVALLTALTERATDFVDGLARNHWSEEARRAAAEARRRKGEAARREAEAKKHFVPGHFKTYEAARKHLEGVRARTDARYAGEDSRGRAAHEAAVRRNLEAAERLAALGLPGQAERAATLRAVLEKLAEDTPPEGRKGLLGRVKDWLARRPPPAGNALTRNANAPRVTPIPAAYAGMRDALVREHPDDRQGYVTEGDVEHRLHVRRSAAGPHQARGEWNDLHRHLGLDPGSKNAVQGTPFEVHAALHRRYTDPMAVQAEVLSHRARGYEQSLGHNHHETLETHGGAAIAHGMAADKAAEEGRHADAAYHYGEVSYHRAKAAGGLEIAHGWAERAGGQPTEHQRQAYRELTAITGRHATLNLERQSGTHPFARLLDATTSNLTPEVAGEVSRWAAEHGHHVSRSWLASGHQNVTVAVPHAPPPTANAHPLLAGMTAAQMIHATDTANAESIRAHGGRPPGPLWQEMEEARRAQRVGGMFQTLAAAHTSAAMNHERQHSATGDPRHATAAHAHRVAAAVAQMAGGPVPKDEMSAQARHASTRARASERLARVAAGSRHYKDAAAAHFEARTAHGMAADKSEEEGRAGDAAYHRYHEAAHNARGHFLEWRAGETWRAGDR